MKRIVILGGCGYIGSALFTYLTLRNYNVDTVDLEWFGNYVNPKNIKKDFSELPKSFYKKYDAIVLLAGHSNYYMCERDVQGSLKNNVVNFVDLLYKLSDQKFIYASTSTIYENARAKIATESIDTFTPLSHYDLTKKEIDYYASLSSINYYALRLGTISGYSPNMRIDLMINRMYEAAVNKKEIIIHNPNIKRPILGINDLSRCIETILKNKSAPGIYNLSSFNKAIKDIAQKVAKKINHSKIIIKQDLPHYESFVLGTKKFENEYSFIFKDTTDTILDSLQRVSALTPKSVRK